MKLFSFENVKYASDGQNILDTFNLSIKAGDFIMIEGPSGSGKTTFLRLMNNLISPTQGELFYKERNIFTYNPVDLRKEISMCFQMPYLFGKTVFDNLSFPFHIRKKDINIKLIEENLEIFNLEKSMLKKDIRNLSGGEKQRISLARTLLFQPNILLLDEITSALDEQNTLIVEGVINNFSNESNAILWITHNHRQITSLGNRKINIDNKKVLEVEI